MEGSGVPGHTEAAREPVQRAAAAATATAAGVSTGKHDGTFYDAKSDGATVHDAADCDARTHTYAYYATATSAAAAADDGAATADDGTNGAIVSSGTAAAIGWAAIGPATALCRIWNESTTGEELLMVRDGKTGSFKIYML